LNLLQFSDIISYVAFWLENKLVHIILYFTNKLLTISSSNLKLENVIKKVKT